jgi:hypothetical protein
MYFCEGVRRVCWEGMVWKIWMVVLGVAKACGEILNRTGPWSCDDTRVGSSRLASPFPTDVAEPNEERICYSHKFRDCKVL